MILASFETPNYLIQTIAEDRADAEQTMQAYWVQHCKDTGASLAYFDLDGVRFDELETGDVLCR